MKPGLRMQMDLMMVEPPGPAGESMVLTVVDVCTRYPWFRPVPTKGAEDVAFALYEIILDAGVVPRVLQSDQGKEFIAAVMQEFIRLLGARQVFSMALHPQTQGVVERLHRELRKVLRLLVGSVS